MDIRKKKINQMAEEENLEAKFTGYWIDTSGNIRYKREVTSFFLLANHFYSSLDLSRKIPFTLEGTRIMHRQQYTGYFLKENDQIQEIHGPLEKLPWQ